MAGKTDRMLLQMSLNPSKAHDAAIIKVLNLLPGGAGGGTLKGIIAEWVARHGPAILAAHAAAGLPEPESAQRKPRQRKATAPPTAQVQAPSTPAPAAPPAPPALQPAVQAPAVAPAPPQPAAPVQTPTPAPVVPAPAPPAAPIPAPEIDDPLADFGVMPTPPAPTTEKQKVDHHAVMDSFLNADYSNVIIR